jgi:LacI family transcriptional regulator
MSPSRRSGAHRPTMADVARLAGVSPTTVSFVFNGRPDSGIPEATQQRVKEAVDELGYRPNRQASGLRTKRTHTIGFLTDEIAVGPFAGRTISGALDIAWSRGHLLFIVNTTRNPRILRRAVDELLDRQVDAIVFAVVGTRSATLPDAIRHVPTILVNCFTPRGAIPAVLPDETAGGRSATQALIDAGHRRVAHITGLPGSWATRKRLSGYRVALSRAGIPYIPELVRVGDYHTESGYEGTRQLLALPQPPTAIFCGNDRMALGAYFAAADAGLQIPTDLSIIGYDDQEELASALHPGLTTMLLPYYDLGRWAVQQILNGTTDGLPARTYLPCPLVLRNSVVPPADAAERPGQSP